MKVVDQPATDWREMPLSDARTGDTFAVSDYASTTTLIESFAVWSPTSRNQKEELQKIADELGNDIVIISLDTERNEDAARVSEYARNAPFSWHISKAPDEMVELLIKEYGIEVINSPSMPMVLICQDSQSVLLPQGFKEAAKLRTEISQGCGKQADS